MDNSHVGSVHVSADQAALSTCMHGGADPRSAFFHGRNPIPHHLHVRPVVHRFAQEPIHLASGHPI